MYRDPENRNEGCKDLRPPCDHYGAARCPRPSHFAPRLPLAQRRSAEKQRVRNPGVAQKGEKMDEERVLSGPWQGFFPGDWVRPRSNPGTWMPLIDVSEIFPGNKERLPPGGVQPVRRARGNRAENRRGLQGSRGFRRRGRVGEGGLSPSDVWYEDGRYHSSTTPRGPAPATRSATTATLDPAPTLGRGGVRRLEKEQHPRRHPPEGGIFEDPSAPPEERFKAMGAGAGWYRPPTPGRSCPTRRPGSGGMPCTTRGWTTGPEGGAAGWMVGWTSPDRFHGWKRIEEPLAEYSVNGGIVAGYDEASGTYYAYMQPQGFARRTPRVSGPVSRRWRWCAGQTASAERKTSAAGRPRSW